MTETVQILGLRELREALMRKIPEHLQGAVLQKALSAGARPVVKAAKQLAPVKTGVLKKAIFTARDKSSSNSVFEQKVVGVRSGKRFQKSKKDAFYWRFIEFGRKAVTAGNRIRTGRLGGSRNSKTKATVLGTPAKGFFGKTVRAVAPRPFLRPAFDQNKRQSVDEIQKSLAVEIQKAGKKARWQTPSR